MVQISPACGPNTNQIMYGESLDFQCHAAFATVARKSFNVKFIAKKFSDRAFHVTITDADIGSQDSLRTLFYKYLGHVLVKFEQNRLVRNKQNFELFSK